MFDRQKYMREYYQKNKTKLKQYSAQYKKEDTIQFSYKLYAIDDEYYHIIKSSRGNVMDGTIIDKKTFNDEYSKIVVDVPMLSYIHYLLNDDLLNIKSIVNKNRCF